MRRALLAIAIALAAAAPSIAAPSGAGPPTCVDPCTITTTDAGYVAPLTEIASGTSVRWVSASGSHPTSNAVDPPARCFLVAAGPGVTPVPVRFDIAGSTVRATTGQVTLDCSTAVALPTGGYVLPFQCLLHPWMHGSLLIEP